MVLSILGKNRITMTQMKTIQNITILGMFSRGFALEFEAFFPVIHLEKQAKCKNYPEPCVVAHAGGRMDQPEHCRLAVPCPWVHEAFVGGTWLSQRCGKFHFCSFTLCSSMLSWDRIFRTCIFCKNLLELYWSSLSCLHKST